jgi:peptidoglycan hydrolase-like protein with peptidoglycan-binding domain
MNMHITKKYYNAALLVPIVAVILAFAASANAAVFAPTCTTLNYGLSFGSNDSWSGGKVTKLQNFLYTEGDMQVSATGYFGPITLHAVKSFQASQGIWTTGFVGPLTRAAISRLSCAGNPPPFATLFITSISPNITTVGSTVTIHGSGFTQDNTITLGRGSIVHIASYDGTSLVFTVPSSLTPACYFSKPPCLIASQQTTSGIYAVSVTNAQGSSNSVFLTINDEHQVSNVRIYSITPTTGPVGTTISITGFGFSNSNIVHLGSGAIGNVPISSSIAIACTTNPSCHGGINQTLVITVPSSIGPYCPPGSMCAMYMQLLTPGPYTIYVANDSGTSNAVSYTVTGTNPVPPPITAPTISGIDAPTILTLGTIGIWTVHATAPAGSTTNLHYSVTWGDNETAVTTLAPSNQSFQSSQSSATFTHIYSQAGTYTATFTVSNDSHLSSTVSSTITVMPLY